MGALEKVSPSPSIWVNDSRRCACAVPIGWCGRSGGRGSETGYYKSSMLERDGAHSDGCKGFRSLTPFKAMDKLLFVVCHRCNSRVKWPSLLSFEVTVKLASDRKWQVNGAFCLRADCIIIINERPPSFNADALFFNFYTKYFWDEGQSSLYVTVHSWQWQSIQLFPRFRKNSLNSIKKLRLPTFFWNKTQLKDVKVFQ